MLFFYKFLTAVENLRTGEVLCELEICAEEFENEAEYKTFYNQKPDSTEPAPANLTIFSNAIDHDEIITEGDLYRPLRTYLKSCSFTQKELAELSVDGYESIAFDVFVLSSADDYYLLGENLDNSISIHAMFFKNSNQFIAWEKESSS